MRTLYRDYNAMAPCDPRVFDATRPFFLDEVGNAGRRTHLFGQHARDAVERAHSQVAALLGCRSDEILFTCGATESNNLVAFGLRPVADIPSDSLIAAVRASR